MLSLDRNSEHGLLAVIRPSAAVVCQSLIVVSYWTPGSAQRHAASAISRIRSRARTVSMTSPVVRAVYGAVNIGSFRISAMIAGLTDGGEMIVLGSGHRASQGVKRGYVVDMEAATHAVRDAIERAEKIANTSLSRVWIGCSGAGLASSIARVEVEIGGRRIGEDDIEHLLVAGARR